MAPFRVLVASAPGAGKSTLCRRVQERLTDMLPSVNGFLSRVAKNTRGIKIGYELYSIDGKVRELVASSEGPESKHTVAHYHVYTDALERVALPVLDAILSASGSRVCIIDDIGNITTQSDALVERVRRVLESKDPNLHVLAALGTGNGGFILDARKIFGIKTMGIDESSRDLVLDSLTARLLNAASQDSADGTGEEDDENEELEDNDLTEFDQWGGDRRQLGIKRGMYEAEVSQDSLLARESEHHPLVKTNMVEKPPASQSSTRQIPQPQKQAVIGSQKQAMSRPATPERIWQTPSGYNAGNGESSKNSNKNGYANSQANGYENSYTSSPSNGYGDTYAKYTYVGVGMQTTDSNSIPCGLTGALRIWLDSLDPDGFLCPYAADLGKLKISSPDEALARYAKDGVLSSQFFADAGIKKLGHRRLFERWFRESAHVLVS